MEPASAAGRSRRHIAPGPPGEPFLGHLRAFRRDVLRLLMDGARFGDVVRFRLGPRVVHLLNHPEHVEHVLLRHAQNYDKATRSVAKMRLVCEEGLLTSDGPAWRHSRGLVQPVMSPRRLETFAALITEEAGAMLRGWEGPAASGEPLDVPSALMRLTSTVAARVLFDADIRAATDDIERALAVLLEHTYRRLGRLVDIDELCPPLGSRRYREAVRTVDAIVYRIIDQRRGTAGSAGDLLSVLLHARDPESGGALSDRRLRNETLTMLLAGYETTAHALAWALYLLAVHPWAAERLHAEAVETLGDRAPTPADFGRLPWTQMVLGETLRLYPPIWILERRAIGEDRVGGFVIPAGSTVVISPYALHRHPAFWDDPERFDPERFLPERVRARAVHAYLPFGAGPHRCVGEELALLEARLVLPMIVRAFRLRPVPGHAVVPDPGITLRFRHSLRLIAEQREGAGG